MKKQWIVGLLLLLVAAFLVYKFSNQEKQEEANNLVKVGAILPLTGKYSDLGNWAKAGILSANDDLISSNSQHSYEILIEDAKSEAKDAVSSYNKLVNIDGVDIIITTSSALSLAIKPRAISDSILLFGIASHPEITASNNGRIFRPCNTSTDESNIITDFIKSLKDSLSRVGILYHNSEFGLSFNNQITNNLDEMIVGSTPYDDAPETFKTIITKTLSSTPDIIVVIGFTPSLGQLIKSLREQSYRGMIVSNIGFSTPSVINSAGESANGVFFVDYELPIRTNHFVTVDSLSQLKYNTKFNSISFLSYFTLKSINYAIEHNKSTKIRDIANFLNTPQKINIDEIELSLNRNGDMLPNLSVKEFYR